MRSRLLRGSNVRPCVCCIKYAFDAFQKDPRSPAAPVHTPVRADCGLRRFSTADAKHLNRTAEAAARQTPLSYPAVVADRFFELIHQNLVITVITSSPLTGDEAL